MPVDQPPLQPTSSIVRDAEDIAEQERKDRKREEDERREAIAAEIRRKNSQTQQE